MALQNHSDFPLLLPGLMRRGKMGGQGDPLTVLHRNNVAGLSFILRYVHSDAIVPADDADNVLHYGAKAADLASLKDDVFVGWKWFDDKYGTTNMPSV